jgi:hypothetical protein
VGKPAPMIEDPRPVGLVIALVGAVGTAISALADPLGIGEGEVFGWLQITGTIVGAIITLLGLALAMEWVPYPWRATRDETVVAGSSPQTNIITSRRSEPEPEAQTNIVTEPRDRPDRD